MLVRFRPWASSRDSQNIPPFESPLTQWKNLKMTNEKTKEPQYQSQLDWRDKHGYSRFGLQSGYTWGNDPRHVLFTLARYKFVAKMFSGLKKVLEVGCGDGMGAHLVIQEVDSLVAVDFDPIYIRDIKNRLKEHNAFDCHTHDILDGPLDASFDGIYSLDVLEHIAQDSEDLYMQNISKSLHEQGVFIAGMPSLESQKYASEGSKAGHVNCKTQTELKRLGQQYFHNVFAFSMNDEIVHTGYHHMAHYIFMLCCGKR